MTIDKYNQLIALCEKVTLLKETNPELFTEDKDTPERFWFSDNDHPLYRELDDFACDEFINDDGQYSDFWYQVRRIRGNGLRLWTGEQDSFGPLVSCITYKGWNFSYG